jgi:hypothetical protein
MKESVFHHYILVTLSGPPLDENERETPRRLTPRHSKALPAKQREGLTRHAYIKIQEVRVEENRYGEAEEVKYDD